MKQNFILISMIIACATIGAVCHSDYNNTASNECCNPSTIKVVGNGQVQVDPDIATIYTSITQDATTANEALNKVNTILNSVQAVLKQNGVPASDIQTSYISVYPKYDYTSGTGVVVGYTVYLSLTITVRGINKNQNKVANIIEGLAMAGVSSVSSVNYDTSQPEVAKSLARKAALADAGRKAKEYADLTCQVLERFLSIDETYVSYAPYYTSSSGVLRASNNGMVPNQTPAIDLPTGKITIYVNVVVSWIVRQSKNCKVAI